ncbi:CobW family GTP-binding protein [Martelella alba]|uniref:GTP-binding protein n=1 Tax=Martelella alba TaxID=2590451 RepID=A0ABY2SLX3_9HYPH|nr:GTP-binding protein [Martelella alba]TKI05827.1 GTP-binding protein [Martelella alba]
MAVKTTMVTGFLGSGKTTTLLHLLASKPAGERWAVLVNEFGEIGIDGALLADSGAILKEIPGGCMCCVNGLPMQVGLNTLLQRHRPDRLLIEPTGLGHPKHILDLLTSPFYESWLTLQATLCLLDARQLGEARYRDNENFRDQLAAADIIIANKQDSYHEDDRRRLAAWARENADGRQIIAATRGNIAPELLDTPRRNLRALPEGRHHHSPAGRKIGLASLSLPPNTPWRRALSSGQDYHACGWIFNAETVFDTLGVLEWARTAPVERVKGVVRIAEGALLVNRQGADLHIETRQAPPPDSRLEMIHSAAAEWNLLQNALLKLRLK